MMVVQFLTRKFVQPGLDKLLNEGREEGRAEGREEGKAEWLAQSVARGETRGRAAAYAEFREWLDRRDAAVARGEPFDEPAPDEAGYQQSGNPQSGYQESGYPQSGNPQLRGSGAAGVSARPGLPAAKERNCRAVCRRRRRRKAVWG